MVSSEDRCVRRHLTRLTWPRLRSPMMRKIIPGHVPDHYQPQARSSTLPRLASLSGFTLTASCPLQIQLCLEIADLEVAHFAEYKPSSITWPLEPQFEVTTVQRDRQWFVEALPRLKAVYDEIQAARAHAKATGVLPYPPPPLPERKPRQKKRPLCLIRDDLYGPVPPPPKRQAACLFGDVSPLLPQTPTTACLFA